MLKPEADDKTLEEATATAAPGVANADSEDRYRTDE